MQTNWIEVGLARGAGAVNTVTRHLGKLVAINDIVPVILKNISDSEMLTAVVGYSWRIGNFA
jgi:hypothetical protein